MALKIALALVVFLVLAGSVAGQDICGDLSPTECSVYTPVAYVICIIYEALLAVAGFIAAMVFVVAGVKWVASQSDPGERKQAKMAMQAALIGLLVILVADEVITAVGDEFEYDCAGVISGVVAGECGTGQKQISTISLSDSGGSAPTNWAYSVSGYCCVPESSSASSCNGYGGNVVISGGPTLSVGTCGSTVPDSACTADASGTLGGVDVGVNANLNCCA